MVVVPLKRDPQSERGSRCRRRPGVCREAWRSEWSRQPETNRRTRVRGEEGTVVHRVSVVGQTQGAGKTLRDVHLSRRRGAAPSRPVKVDDLQSLPLDGRRRPRLIRPRRGALRSKSRGVLLDLLEKDHDELQNRHGVRWSRRSAVRPNHHAAPKVEHLKRRVARLDERSASRLGDGRPSRSSNLNVLRVHPPLSLPPCSKGPMSSKARSSSASMGLRKVRQLSSQTLQLQVS